MLSETRRFFVLSLRCRISAKVQTALAAAGSVAEQSLSLVKVVRAHANEDHERRRCVLALDILFDEYDFDIWYKYIHRSFRAVSA